MNNKMAQSTTGPVARGTLSPADSAAIRERIARRWFPDYPGRVPPGAFPAGWVPAR